MGGDVLEMLPGIMTKCRVCTEPLLNDKGSAPQRGCHIMCMNLVHDECGSRETEILHADRMWNSIGGLGLPQSRMPRLQYEKSSRLQTRTHHMRLI